MPHDENREVIKKYFLERLDFYKECIIRDIGRLVAMPSVRDENTIKKNMPFGEEISRAFDLIKEIADEFSLKCEIFDGYALHIEYGESTKVVGILTHTDIVPCGEISKWESDPYVLDLRDGFMYGRGVNDDKASIIGLMYIMRILKEAGYKPQKKIRLIVGGAEETTWECMKYYLSKNSPPDIAFSPDCDFPVVNCEKGILRGELRKNIKISKASTHKLVGIQCYKSHDFALNHIVVEIETKDYAAIEICAKGASRVCLDGDIATVEYISNKNLSRNPQRSPHAACDFFEDFSHLSNIDEALKNILYIIGKWFPQKPFGESIGISYTHQETGYLTMALCYLSYSLGELAMGFDIRYPAGIEEDYILKKLSLQAEEDKLSVQVIQRRERLYIPSDSYLVKTLLDSYETVMGEHPAPVTKGGASYSRAIPNCVGFGPTFAGETPNSHKENECMSVESFFKALEIYLEAILRL
ncbi:Sapep family Mn(2+)-dependent dipeptidase [Desnuesiella massiliensis]|uniref:Sapep family Mn(2+)-dependent dipeptidase n=1 Tax=Desnuesiella massiliensis TaxID=1650662 RepID=UPI0006E1B05F|nr:Sapep family Mn(2+)-dependent dipeptidase [Desnuesiella massiliensis]